MSHAWQHSFHLPWRSVSCIKLSWKDENQGQIWGELGWSRVASACSGLERALSSQPETEARPQQWEHQTLTTRPVVSDKSPGPSALQERTSTKMESSKAKSVCLEEKQYIVCGHTHGWIQRERTEFYSCGNLNYFYGVCLWISFGQSFTWFTAYSWYISGSSHVCACIS